jgi:4-nitrophenyl phosphatase
MVGDRPETDIAFGAASGWTTVLTLSGVVDDPAGVPAGLRPDLVVGSLAELPGLIA